MEFKNSFLSRLFGSREQAEDVPEETEAGGPLPVQPPEEDQPQEQPRHRLNLPPEHSLRKLWALYTEQTGWYYEPELVLEGPSDPPMPDREGSAELLRLQMFVNSSANERINRILAQQKQTEEEQTSLPDLDAQVTVFLSRDCMTAWLLVYPPVGEGRELEREDLDHALTQQLVRFGVDKTLLDVLPQDPERYFRLISVAKGVEPEHGRDGRVVDMFPRIQERKLTVDENNRVDYADLNFIHNVEQGGVICRVFPPADGIPGRTVQDQEIPARNGKPASVPQGRNTKLSEDGRALVAAITGHVEFSGRSFQVKPVLDIPGNVDFSVGNINFLGDVCIHGDVCSGFSVRAMGTITVNGVVEACSLEAGRDLVVSRGVQGDGQAVLRAQRSIFAKYLENCCVYARVSLETECIINCDVYCDGGVTVCSGHRSIIGGKIHAAHEVDAGSVGSRVGNRTDIVLGGRPCDEFDYDLLSKEIVDMEEEMERTERQPDSPSKISRISKLRMQLLVSRGKLESIEKDREQKTTELQDPGIRRMKCDTVFPGTVLTIGTVAHHFYDKLSPCSATLVDNEIQLI
ncbi:MAG: DUF342 domain-containing protein [Oscillibacter sp.]|nr:DUF342 domain-containing protein [Oscillibacter sp.]